MRGYLGRGKARPQNAKAQPELNLPTWITTDKAPWWVGIVVGAAAYFAVAFFDPRIKPNPRVEAVKAKHDTVTFIRTSQIASEAYFEVFNLGLSQKQLPDKDPGWNVPDKYKTLLYDNQFTSKALNDKWHELRLKLLEGVEDTGIVFPAPNRDWPREVADLLSGFHNEARKELGSDLEEVLNPTEVKPSK